MGDPQAANTAHSSVPYMVCGQVEDCLDNVPFIWAGSFHGLQRDLCPHSNVVKPLKRGYILFSAPLPEGSHRGLNLLNWMTG